MVVRMREIKFRVWDNIRNDYVRKPSDVRLNCDTGELHGFMSNGNVEQWEAEQYTGLKDKNDVEIYEGDILEFEPEEWGSNSNNRWTVEWDNKTGSWSFGDGVTSDLKSYVKIIGNIHQNPGLLK